MKLCYDYYFVGRGWVGTIKCAGFCTVIAPHFLDPLLSPQIFGKENSNIFYKRKESGTWVLHVEVRKWKGRLGKGEHWRLHQHGQWLQ